MEKITAESTDEDVRNRQREYWRNKNLQFDSKNYFLELFLKQNNFPVADWKRDDLKIDAGTAKSILKVCNNSDISLYILMVTLFKIAASKYTNEALVTVCSPLYQAGQGSAMKEYVALQDKVVMDGLIKENVQENRKTIIGAYSNQSCFMVDRVSEFYNDDELEKILENNVLCLLGNIHNADSLLNNFPMSIHLHRENETISGWIYYDAGCLCEDLVKLFCTNFSQFIENACKDFNQRIEDIDLLPVTELDRILEYSRGKVTAVPANKLHQLFEEQEEKTPAQVALIYDDERVTYQQLNELANKAARGLMDRGVKPGDYIVLLFARGIEMIAAILAVLKTGAAFIPVSPDEKDERLNFILEETAAKFILSDQLDFKTHVQTEILSVNKLVSQFTGTSVCNPDVEFDNTTAAYIIFTSGTTGLPKGVIIEHRSIVNANIWRQREYRFGNEDVELLLFAYNFDGFILNLFTPVILGATIVLINETDAKDPRAIAEYIYKYNVTHFTAVPVLYHVVLEQGRKEQMSSLRRVTLAGDVTEPKTILLSKQLNDKIIISNEYGPTENAVVSTYLEAMNADSSKVIGRPVDNVNAYILDSKRNIVPVGVFGEICLTNVGLARGYLNDAVLTGEKFISWNGERLYQTGDSARWLPGGEIEFKGRINDQVKLRGFRIELEEIRSCILLHKEVKEAVVVMLGENADAGLYACITIQNKIEPDQLKKFLSNKLPYYMIPQEFILFQSIPVMDSGKYDITAIKKEIKRFKDSAEKELPFNEIEQRLIGIWKDILKVDSIGVNQNFFLLGGHSLKATTLLSEIHNVFEVSLSLNQVFITNTVKELAKVIENLKGSRIENIPAIPLHDYYLLSSAQERLFVLDKVENSGMSYNIPIAFLLIGKLDTRQLEYALNSLVQRHESLRTSFVYVDDQPVQVINESCTVTIIEKNIPATSNIEEQIAGLLSPFDLGKAPLFRVNLLRIDDNKTCLLFDFNHIIIDETSLALFFDELVKLYNNEKIKTPSLSYKDYASWQRQRQKSDDYKAKLNYWINKLSGKNLQPLNLPYDHRRANRATYEGGRVQVRIKPKLFDAIQQLCRNNESTNFMFFMAAFTLLLNKYTNQKEIIVGSPVSERAHPGTRDLVGVFLNTLPLLNTIDTALSFLEYLENVKSNIIADINNSDVQFDDLVKAINLERELAKNPVFNVMLAIIDNDVTHLQFETIKSENLSIHNKTSKFDFMLEVHTSESDIALCFEYATSLFNESTIDRIARSFEILLENIVDNPQLQLADLKILSDSGRIQLLESGRALYNGSTSDETIVSLFEKQVLERPAEVALVLGDEELTYEALNKSANKIAREIKKIISPGEIVAVLCGRAFAGIINILAVQKAGGAYLPLDITYPKERINTILSNSKTKILLTDQDDVHTINFTGKIIRTDQIDLSANADTNLELACTPDSPAYVLYTSGTTGAPKGVLIGQKNVVNLMTKAPSYFSVSNKDVWTMFHSYCFDVSVWEMYASLLYGGRLVIVPTHVAQDPKDLLKLITEKGVTILCQPPSAFYLLSEEMTSSIQKTSLRYVILGGEAVRLYKLKNWYKYYKNVKLVNGYGITETTVYSTYKEITPYDIEHNINSIGAPVQTNYMYILDEQMELCSIGVLGEIYIGGLCVGKGYLNNQELTDKKFIEDPFAAGQLIYRTGDLARWLPNGEIDYFSRLDHQVKVRGFRVEISEIENILSQYETIKDVAIIGLDDEENGTQLVAYFTSAKKLDITQVRTHIGRYLSHYMIPAYIIQIDMLPLSTNGKVDRSKLPNPKTLYKEEPMKRKADTPLEKLLVDIWSDILGLSPAQISIDDNFFFIGGDSISASLVVRKLNSYNLKAKIADIFENDTIVGLCEIIISKQAIEKNTATETDLLKLLAYWKDTASKEVEPLPKLNHAAIEYSSEPQKIDAELPFRALRAITDKESNHVRLPDILLTCLGMTLRMWTGENRFRVTFFEAAQGDSPAGKIADNHDLVYPLILEIEDVNQRKENLENTIQRQREAAGYKVNGHLALEKESYKTCLMNDVFFQYYGSNNKQENINPRALNETAVALAEKMKKALRISCFVYEDAVKLEVACQEEVYNSKSIKLVLENLKFSLRQLIDYYNENSDREVLKEKVIHEVEPFNGVFYRDCTYQAFLPAIHYFGRSFQLLFANSNSVYEVDETSKNVKFKNKYVLDKTDQELFHALGINVNRFFDSPDICEDLMNYLSHGTLAIVQVDCYHIARKKELYHKKHGAHSMLVYGYDKKSQLFNIIDNHAVLGIDYKKNKISFDELKTAYTGYNDNFNSLRNKVTLFTVSKKEEELRTNYNDEILRTIAIENLKKIKHRLPESMNALDFLYTNFTGIVSNEQMLMTNVSQLNHVIGEILNAKKIESYKAAHILKDEVMAEVVAGIVERLEFVKNVLTKMELSQTYSYSSAMGMQDKLQQIVGLEASYATHIENLKS